MVPENSRGGGYYPPGPPSYPDAAYVYISVYVFLIAVNNFIFFRLNPLMKMKHQLVWHQSGEKRQKKTWPPNECAGIDFEILYALKIESKILVTPFVFAFIILCKKMFNKCIF